MNFAEQCPVFLASLAARKNRPVKPATLSTWKSAIECHIEPALGTQSLAAFSNKGLKEFADALAAKGLSPRSICGMVALVKRIIDSAVDQETGERRYQKQFNMAWVDLPPVKPAKSSSPNQQTIENVIGEAPTKVAVLVALLAATGLRIGECLSLRCADDGVHSGYDYSTAVLHVRTAMWNGRENLSPKTQAGIRTVDLHPEINEVVAKFCQGRTGFMFASRNRTALGEKTCRKYLAGIQGFHALRRFRISWCRKNRSNEDWLRSQIGHANRGITDSYVRLDDEFRKAECFRCGLGFTIPERLCNFNADPSRGLEVSPRSTETDSTSAIVSI